MANSIRLTTEELKELGKDASYNKNPINILLHCDKNRFGDDYEYPEAQCKDINNGHWDLWFDSNDEQFPEEVDLGGEYYERNPSEDIKDGEIVAIDFGTSATVVVVTTEDGDRRPLAIDASADNTKGKRYENPTIMELVDLDTFKKMYFEREGRPFTRWEQVSVANKASEDFKNAAAEDYYAFLYQLKQWAGNSNKTIKFKPKTGNVELLPSYATIEKGDFDPIELYAYYIGLNINKLKTKSIYLKYYLSFPASFKEDLLRKVKRSFERGLKKSLPVSVLNNEEKMKKFSVNTDISEPLAYASCVLREYGIRPPKDEGVNYAIFDFGGGTTDFNFGKWKKYSVPEDISYSYEIENLGTEGLDVLGGENLLEGLAFEIFKSNPNFEVMKNNKYFFQKGPDSKEFLGSEDVIDEYSQFAARNMKRLMEVLRPYWEKAYYYNYRTIKYLIDHTEEELDNGSLLSIVQSEILFYQEKREGDPNSVEILQQLHNLAENCRTEELVTDNNVMLRDIFLKEIENDEPENKKILLKVELTDSDGASYPGEELETTEDFIFDFFESKIGAGIEKFFAALDSIEAFKSDKNMVHIFLAGNSCKSPIVSNLFRKKIKEKTTESTTYKLYYPLGTVEAEKYMEDNNVKPKNIYVTGKTGVAFGLIDCSERGCVYIPKGKVYSSNFKCFLGYDNDGYFEPYTLIDVDTGISMRGKPENSKWYRIQGLNAVRSPITMYAMLNAECLNSEVRISGNVYKTIPIELPYQDKTLSLFLRATDATKVQIALASSSEKDIESNKKYDLIYIDLANIGG